MAPTATEKEQATFRSRDENLRLVRKSKTEKLTSTGDRVPVPGVAYEFRNGVLDKQADGLTPLNADDLAWLREHRLLNVDGGFFEVGNEPDRPRPEADDVIAGLFTAGFDKDVEKVRDLIRLEYASHSRPAVINAGRSVLKQLGEDPDEGTRPPSGPVSAEEIDEIAKQLQARLDDHGTLLREDADTDDADPGEKPDPEAEIKPVNPDDAPAEDTPPA